MLIGQTIFVPSTGSPGTVLYGPWMPRQGNAFTAVIELMKTSSTGWTFVLGIETKNAEDKDSDATSLASSSLTTIDTHELAATGCKELVRYKFSVTSGAERWIHFRMNPPIWQPN
jgi:hypothetical protein